MVEQKHNELNELYKKSAINLQIIGGFIMLLIFVNIKEMYHLIPKDYSGGIAVVFMIGLSKFYDVLLGNNNSIIVNTQHYRTVLLFGVATVLLMIILNMILIPILGIEGSALATLITVVIYNTVKLIFVIQKMDLFPFTPKTMLLVRNYRFLLCFILFLGFPFSPHPQHTSQIDISHLIVCGSYFQNKPFRGNKWCDFRNCFPCSTRIKNHLS